MTQIDDGQAAAATNAHVDSAALGTGGVTATPTRPSTDATVPSFVSGTAQQLSTKYDADLYINVTTAAALTIAIGPTSAAAVVLNASESDALGLITLRVPRGWYVKLTGTMANLALNTVLYGNQVA